MNLKELREHKRTIQATIKDLQQQVRDLRKTEKKLLTKHRTAKNACQYSVGCTNLTSPRRELKNIGKFYRHCDEHRAQIKGRRI